MSSPSSSYSVSQSHQFRIRRKVPDGSQDFQKVLDTILSDGSENLENNKENLKEDEDRHFYEDDFEHSDVEECHVLENNVVHTNKSKRYKSKDDIHIHFRTNNYISGEDNSGLTHSHKAERYKIKERSFSTQSPVPHSGVASPSLIHIFDCNGDLVYNSEGECDDKNRGRDSVDSGLKLPSINQKDFQTPPQDNAMGTNCSTGLYDQRDWHNIIGQDGHLENKVRKKGKPFSKKQQLKLNSTKDGCGVVTSQLCTCKHRISDISPDPVSDPIPIAVNGSHKDKSPSDSEKGLIGSRLSDKSQPISRSVSPNPSSRISRMLGLKKSSSSSSSSSPKNDVSPHRLLVRRSYSPKSRASSMEEMIRLNNDSVYRQRSHSWSNGKLSSSSSSNPNPKPTSINLKFNNNSTTSSSSSSTFIQSPILSPVANHTALVSPRTISNNNSSSSSSSLSSKNEKQKDKILPEITTQTQLVTNSAHEESCPLYSLYQNKDTLSPYGSTAQDDVDETITPIARRRAVSESQTLRSRQKARRAAANASLQSGHETDDHLHVHWADETGGTSLSTSVFLSSIRPRSYSHGAECNVPQRPILKKVLIS